MLGIKLHTKFLKCNDILSKWYVETLNLENGMLYHFNVCDYDRVRKVTWK